MNGKMFWWAVPMMLALIFAAGAGVSAQEQPRAHLRGVINDYPVSANPTARASIPVAAQQTGVINDYPVSANPTAGPWELRGTWSLDLRSHSTANFSAALTMEYSDLAAGSGSATDARHQHTHHVIMNGATLILNPPQSDCPVGITPYPTYTWQLEVTGMADVTGNGGSPFSGPVPLQVCFGGGPNLQISNITLVFTNLPSGDPSPATNHFGSQAIHGVVLFPKQHPWNGQNRTKLER